MFHQLLASDYILDQEWWLSTERGPKAVGSAGADSRERHPQIHNDNISGADCNPACFAAMSHLFLGLLADLHARMAQLVWKKSNLYVHVVTRHVLTVCAITHAVFLHVCIPWDSLTCKRTCTHMHPCVTYLHVCTHSCLPQNNDSCSYSCTSLKCTPIPIFVFIGTIHAPHTHTHAYKLL
jgi:hypothetical protein